MTALDFHGAFATRAKANAKAKTVAGGQVRRTKIKGKVRYLVFSQPGGRGIVVGHFGDPKKIARAKHGPEPRQRSDESGWQFNLRKLNFFGG